jgi:hypothetical protein
MKVWRPEENANLPHYWLSRYLLSHNFSMIVHTLQPECYNNASRNGILNNIIRYSKINLLYAAEVPYNRRAIKHSKGVYSRAYHRNWYPNSTIKNLENRHYKMSQEPGYVVQMV